MITADHFIAPFLTGVHFEYKSRIIRMSKTPGSLIGFRGLNIAAQAANMSAQSVNRAAKSVNRAAHSADLSVQSVNRAVE